MRAGARIAAGAGRSVLDREGAETAQLDPVAARERVDDLAEDRVDDVLDIALIKMRILRGDALNQFGLDHRHCRPHERPPRAGLKARRAALRAQLPVGGCQRANRPSRLRLSTACTADEFSMRRASDL